MDLLFVSVFVAAGLFWFICGAIYIRYNLGRGEPAMILQMGILMIGTASMLGVASPWGSWRWAQGFGFFALTLMVFGWGCTFGRDLLERHEIRTGH